MSEPGKKTPKVRRIWEILLDDDGPFKRRKIVSESDKPCRPQKKKKSGQDGSRKETTGGQDGVKKDSDLSGPSTVKPIHPSVISMSPMPDYIPLTGPIPETPPTFPRLTIQSNPRRDGKIQVVNLTWDEPGEKPTKEIPGVGFHTYLWKGNRKIWIVVVAP